MPIGKWFKVNTDLGDMADTATADSLADIATTSAHAKLRRLLLRFSADAFSAAVNPGAAAATDVETMVRDLANILAGATGIVTFPAAAAPANGVSMAKVLHYIADALDALFILTETGGTLTADGNEQNIVINNAPSALFKPLTVKIDLDLMQDGDTTVIKVYDRIKSGGGLQQVDYQSYAGVDGGLADSSKVIYISLKENRYGFKVTLQQTGGTNRNYDYEYLYEAAP